MHQQTVVEISIETHVDEGADGRVENHSESDEHEPLRLVGWYDAGVDYEADPSQRGAKRYCAVL